MRGTEFTESELKAIDDYIATRKKLDGKPSDFTNRKHVLAFKSESELMFNVPIDKKKLLSRPYNANDFNNLTSASNQFNDVYANNTRLAPDDVNGVKRGKPMSLNVADVGNSNPGITSNGNAFKVNCQTCVPVFELRCRGYDVVASKNTESKGSYNAYLSFRTMEAFLDPNTLEPKKNRLSQQGPSNNNEEFYYKKQGGIKDSGLKIIDQFVDDFEKAPCGRYAFAFNTYYFGHIVSIVKDEKGARVMDPQHNDTLTVSTPLKDYLMRTVRDLRDIRVSRTDNAIVNPDYYKLYLPRQA